MRRIFKFDPEDVLVRKEILIWSSQDEWVKKNKINLSSLFRTLLRKEILRRKYRKEVRP